MNLKTISQFSHEYPAFPVGGIRWQIFNQDKNGLKESGAIVRIGRKVLIDPDKFFSWIKKQQDKEPFNEINEI